MKTCCIFGSAPIKDYYTVEIPENCFIIAADGGYDHICRLGLKADLAIGDFDSLKTKISPDCRVITVPSQKDDTDMMLCIKKALEMGFTEILIFGALGGRLDHTIANIQGLEFICHKGGNGTVFGDNDIVTLQSVGTEIYQRRKGFYFSVFAVSDKAFVSISGAKYNLDNYCLERYFPLGVSNEISGEYVTVEVKSGLLLVVFSKKL